MYILLSSYYSYPFLHLSNALIPSRMLPSLSKPIPLTLIQKDILFVQRNPIISSSFHHPHHLPSFSCGCSNTTPSFTLEDLISSRGLPEKFRDRCESSVKPNSVLNLLRSYGFSRTQIETIITKYSPVLFCDAEKTLKPKIDFLGSLGLSETEVRDVVTTCPHLFRRSLNNHLVPFVDFLKTTMGGSQEDLIDVIKKDPFILYNTSRYLGPNLSTLRNLGIPRSQISSMMATSLSSRVLSCTKPSRFVEVVSTLKEMGFDPMTTSFQQAVRGMLFCSQQSSWEEKLLVYKTMGFSAEETLNIFRTVPSLMAWSEKRVRAVVEFYVNKFRWSPSQLSTKVVVLAYSLEKRIIPRSLVLQLLLSRNRICKDVSLITVLRQEEEVFLQKYVIPYKDETPEVLDAYHGKIKSAESDSYWEELRRLSQYKIL